MQAVCPECNTLNPISNQFCGSCGASLETAKVVQQIPQTQVTQKQQRRGVGCRGVLTIIVILVLLFLLYSCWRGLQSVDSPSGSYRTATPETQITILSAVQGKSQYGRTQVVVHIRNDTGHTAGGVKVHAECYRGGKLVGHTAGGVKVHAECYRGGKLVATDWHPADPYDLEPAMDVGVTVRFDEGVICDDIKVRTTVHHWP
jgi:hypothetical protein